MHGYTITAILIIHADHDISHYDAHWALAYQEAVKCYVTEVSQKSYNYYGSSAISNSILHTYMHMFTCIYYF